MRPIARIFTIAAFTGGLLAAASAASVASAAINPSDLLNCALTGATELSTVAGDPAALTGAPAEAPLVNCLAPAP
ncbi:hypothetical protein DP939_35640 [Spongiactinospora rosea]|uniref:Uncharacterized protein n=1 Tax=Spongiactinospora rosea TaxID=2248750 RepID=A0A366LNC7_9ACTN|nr:hypothetical protein [Spongiactinospora rosea]RBQ15428.1 hypothetical protein DP939_35640 [Spongiactinospora rosea]